LGDVSKADVDGLGVRVNKMSIVLAKTEERSEANEKNIEKLGNEFESKTQIYSDKADKISNRVVLGAVILVLGLFIKEFLIRGAQ
jgi:hypothetical protein